MDDSEVYRTGAVTSNLKDSFVTFVGGIDLCSTGGRRRAFVCRRWTVLVMRNNGFTV